MIRVSLYANFEMEATVESAVKRYKVCEKNRFTTLAGYGTVQPLDYRIV